MRFIQRHHAVIRWVCYGVIVVGLFLIARSVPLEHWLESLRDWLEDLGWVGPVIFAAIYVLAVVLLLPASPLSIAAGVLFGLWIGALVVWFGANIGATLAFLIARHLARRRTKRLVDSRPRLRAIDDAIGRGGWRIVAMLRLSPVVPFNLQNYFYGVTSIRFRPCVLTTAVAMIPGIFLYVYLGYSGASIVGAGEAEERSPWQWAFLGVGLAATIAVTVYLTILAKKELREQTPGEGLLEEGEEKRDRKPPSMMRLGALIAAAAAVLAAGLFMTFAGVAIFELLDVDVERSS